MDNLLAAADHEVMQGALLMPRRRIVPSETQPRSEFEEEHVKSLADNIRGLRSRGQGIAGTGILQPLLVRWEPGAILQDGTVKPDAQVIITAGETRFHATGAAGFKPDDPLPVMVESQNSDVAYEHALYENIHRSDLSPLDQARAIRHMMNREGLSFRQVSKRIGKPLTWVQLRLDALRAAPDVQSLLDDRPGSLTIVQRIDRVKEPELRAELIEAAREGASQDDIKARISSYRKYNPTALDNPEVYGSPKTPGVPQLPRIDLNLALTSANRQVASALDAGKAVSLSPEIRRQVRVRLEELQRLTDEFQELVKHQARGRPKNKRKV